jgi:sulfur transfer protein SufE
MEKIRNEIYDDKGLVEVVFIETENQTPEEILAQKETELLAIYKEIELLRNKI